MRGKKVVVVHVLTRMGTMSHDQDPPLGVKVLILRITYYFNKYYCFTKYLVLTKFTCGLSVHGPPSAARLLLRRSSV